MTYDAQVCIVHNDDDWEGLYVNGQLLDEAHKLSADAILSALEGATLIGYERRICDRDWLHEQGFLPGYLDDVKWPSS